VVCLGGAAAYWVGVWRRRREFEGRGLGFVFEDSFEGGGEEPGWWEDVSSSLAFEEEGEPEGQRRAMRRAESRRWALWMLDLVGEKNWKGEESVWWGWRGQVLTPRRFRLSSRWRGITVTISISQRKATSIGVKPVCRGNAMVGGKFCVSLLKLDAVWVSGDAIEFLMPQVQRGGLIWTFHPSSTTSPMLDHLMILWVQLHVRIRGLSKDTSV